MVFSSVLFIFFYLPIVLVIYFIVPEKFKNLVLFISGLIFYAWGEPKYVFLMLFTILVDFTCGFLVYKYLDRKYIARWFVAASVCFNIAILCYFKYTGFALTTINSLTGLSIHIPAIALPIGISFYTFQTMSYAIETYQGKVTWQRNFINYGAYVTMFPHLLAGPIMRYCVVEKQLEHHSVSGKMFTEGVERFLIGLFKKVLIANNIALIWDTVQASPTISTLSAWIGILAYTFQIYFDFSGYSDMAIGMGKMFGFIYPENFNYPYTSKSITEFWRRWHMTLGQCIREYIYFPLGGNRVGKLKQIRNLIIVWLLTGLWHGANWNFVLWGAFYGVLIICEKFFLLKFIEKLPNILQHTYTMLSVIVGWVLFTSTSASFSWKLLKAMFGFAPKIDSLGIFGLRTYLPLFVIAAVCSTPIALRSMEILRKKSIYGKAIWVAFYAAATFIAIAALVDATYNPFLYFKF